MFYVCGKKSMKEKSSAIKINLSGRPRENLQNLVVKWAVNIGKIIIVLTEMVALGALVFRFMVDKQIVDLHDKIKREQLLLQSQAAREKEYRGIQERLAMINAVTIDSQAKLEVTNLILDAQKAHAFTATNLIIAQKSILISGTSPSILTINPFLTTLKQDPNVVSLSIEEITSGGDGILFKLNIGLKSQPSLSQ